MLEDIFDGHPLFRFDLEDPADEVLHLVGVAFVEAESLLLDVVVDVLDLFGSEWGVAVHELV